MAHISVVKNEDLPNAGALLTNSGLHIQQKENCVRALPYFDKSIQLNPNHLRSIRARAGTSLALFKNEEAKKDLEDLLKFDPGDIKGLARKALITYQCSEFEQSIIQNLRMTKLRIKPEYFVHGVMHCKDAIQNSIGLRAGHPLRDHYHIIRRTAWLKSSGKQDKMKGSRSDHRSRKKKHVSSSLTKFIDLPERHLKSVRHKMSVAQGDTQSTLSESAASLGYVNKEDDKMLEGSISKIQLPVVDSTPGDKLPFKPLQRYTRNIQNYMAERYLDRLYEDKVFLQSIKQENGFLCPNDAGNEKIKSLVRSAQKRLCNNQETLRSRRPFYFYKYQAAKREIKFRGKQSEQLENVIRSHEKEANMLLQRCQNAANEGNIHSVSDYAEKLRRFCETTLKSFLPKRDEILLKLFSIACDGYLNAKRFKHEITEAEKIARARVYLNFPLVRTHSKDSVHSSQQNFRINYRKMYSLYQDRIKKANYEEEAAWLFYELARLHYHRKDYQLSKIYAKRCFAVGESLNDRKWKLNALWLSAKCFIAQKNKNDARNELRRIRLITRYFQDDELTDFINVCISVVETERMDENNPDYLIHERQKKILNLLPTNELKIEADKIFRKIQNLPPKRRMPVLPGVSYVTVSTKNNEAHSTIDQSGKGSRSKRSQSTKAYPRRGIHFMELIQYHVED